MMPQSPVLGTILIADDDPVCAEIASRLMRRSGYDVVVCCDGAAALEQIARDPPDLMLLDVEMPHVQGIDVCRRVKNDPSTRLIPVVLVTGRSTSQDRVRGIDAGADDFLTKPFAAEELDARVRSLMRVRRYINDLESAESIILSLAQTVEARDQYTRGHCDRLAHYAMALGVEIGLPEEEQGALYRGGYLHDIGKVGIPDHVLLKPSALSSAEYELMKQHTIIGDRLCGNLRALRLVRPIVRHHHERLDGSGYPDGLRGEEIPLLAQVVSIADTYDAMTTDRPYRAALPAARAFDELRKDATRGMLRPDLVEAFISLGERGRLAVVAASSLRGQIEVA
jgi:putative two-component system response regulator